MKTNRIYPINRVFASIATLLLLESCGARSNMSTQTKSQSQGSLAAVASDSTKFPHVAEVSENFLFDGVVLELDEATGLTVVVFQGIKAATIEVPRHFGSTERLSVVESKFRPKKLKTIIVDGATWALIEIESNMYWVSL